MSAEIKIVRSIQLLEIFFGSHMPFDGIMSKFFRNNRGIGSRERREIAEFVYEIFRDFERTKYFVENYFKSNEDARLFAIVHLKIHEKKSTTEICKIFSGKYQELHPLNDSEKKVLDEINEKISLPLHVELNFPAWTEEYFMRAFENSPDRLRQEMQLMNQRASLDLRVNTLRASKQEVIDKLLLSGIRADEMRFAKNGLRVRSEKISRSHEIISEGLAEIQDEGSQMIAELCDPAPGDTVVDFCAGAGGKTLALAALMNNKGRIFALDKYVYRLDRAKERLRRANVNNVFCQEITGKWLKRHAESADVVLVDAPCSGTGTWRRNPDMRARFSKNDLDELTTLQAEILAQAQKLVKKGGRLIYATCSLFIEEDENQIEKFLQNFPEFTLQQINIKNNLNNEIECSGKYMKLSPAKFETDGFFAAVMKKDEDMGSY